MTAQERQAIGFLLAVTLLGAGVRVMRAKTQRTHTTSADSIALQHQIEAVDSALVTRSAKKRRLPKSRKERVAEHAPPPAPSATLDITAVPQRRGVSSNPLGDRQNVRVDLDVAGKEEIERLPWVGPSLAARIVEYRERCGSFGSAEALEAVPGIGKRTTERLSEYVTFSGGQRPISGGPKPCQKSRTLPEAGARKRRP